MSDKPISVGDLVVLYKPCPGCGLAIDLGTVFRVVCISSSHGLGTNCCGAEKGAQILANNEPVKHSGWPMSRLKRIPPLEELDEVRAADEVGA
jgi:hypothetical protein